MPNSLKVFLAILTVALVSSPITAQSRRSSRLPIIDMHIHAEPLSEFGGPGAVVCAGDKGIVWRAIDPKTPFTPESFGPCASPLKAPLTDEKLFSDTLAMFDRYNIRRAVVAGPLDLVTKWHSSAPDRVIRGLSFADRDPAPSEFRKLFNEKRFSAFAEVGMQYRGLSPDDEKYEPYFALAEELDIPVAIHLGEGPPGGIHLFGPPNYRVRLGSPLLLEEVLVRHPKLRVYVMHYGSPLVDEMIAMLFSHPNLYVDVACNNWGFPRKQFYDHLKRMVDAGFEKRILFGSDQMSWPQAIQIAVDSIEKAPFLSASQKRDILYNNAARFLRLSKEEISSDHSK